MNYYHLSIEERTVILQLHISRFSIREIARQLDRSPSTISRELKRNCYRIYNPANAQRKYFFRKKDVAER